MRAPRWRGGLAAGCLSRLLRHQPPPRRRPRPWPRLSPSALLILIHPRRSIAGCHLRPQGWDASPLDRSDRSAAVTRARARARASAALSEPDAIRWPPRASADSGCGSRVSRMPSQSSATSQDAAGPPALRTAASRSSPSATVHPCQPTPAATIGTRSGSHAGMPETRSSMPGSAASMRLTTHPRTRAASASARTQAVRRRAAWRGRRAPRRPARHVASGQHRPAGAWTQHRARPERSGSGGPIGSGRDLARPGRS